MKSLRNKIAKVTNQSKRGDILRLQDQIVDAEMKAEAAHEAAMQEIHDLRTTLDENSNKEPDNE